MNRVHVARAVALSATVVVVGAIVWDWGCREHPLPSRVEGPALDVIDCDGALQGGRLDHARAWWGDRCHVLPEPLPGPCAGPVRPGQARVELCPQGRPDLYDWGTLHVKDGKLEAIELCVRTERDELAELHLVGHLLGFDDLERPGHVMASHVQRGDGDAGLDACGSWAP